jgi:hypothetical protein
MDSVIRNCVVFLVDERGAKNIGNLFQRLLIKRKHGPAIILAHGDDWLRRLRLVVYCEPSGADLVNSAQKIKCQKH